MNLTQIALENNRVTIVVLLVVAAAGLAGYRDDAARQYAPVHDPRRLSGD